MLKFYKIIISKLYITKVKHLKNFHENEEIKLSLYIIRHIKQRKCMAEILPLLHHLLLPSMLLREEEKPRAPPETH